MMFQNNLYYGCMHFASLYLLLNENFKDFLLTAHDLATAAVAIYNAALQDLILMLRP